MRAIQPSAWTSARSQGAMKPDSVLFHAPTSAFQAPGGGENQLVQTGKQLEDLGVTVRLFPLGSTGSRRPASCTCSGCRGKGSNWLGWPRRGGSAWCSRRSAGTSRERSPSWPQPDP